MGKPHVLIVVENLSVPFDRRVWQESEALSNDGYEVSVICPTGPGYDTELDTFLSGVHILRYPLTQASGGIGSYIREYAAALWHTTRLAIKVSRQRRVDVIQACNPPDIFFLVALLLRPFGTRFVFDHHDLVPELFASRFSGAPRIIRSLIGLAERLTFSTADAVICTNESYRRLALTRGKVAPARAIVVRSAPDPDRFRRVPPNPSLRRRQYLIAYLGVMGPQDGVDYALRALRHLHFELGRDDVHTIFMGSGDCYSEMVRLSSQLGLDAVVEFPGRVSDNFVQECLSTADLCLAPDPKNPLNNLSSMNKIVEYMTVGCPIVSFNLEETRVTAGDAAVYASANDDVEFADAINQLLDDPEQRARMAETGRQRVEQEFSWDVSRKAYLQFYSNFLRDGS